MSRRARFGDGASLTGWRGFTGAVLLLFVFLTGTIGFPRRVLLYLRLPVRATALKCRRHIGKLQSWGALARRTIEARTERAEFVRSARSRKE